MNLTYICYILILIIIILVAILLKSSISGGGFADLDTCNDKYNKLAKQVYNGTYSIDSPSTPQEFTDSLYKLTDEIKIYAKYVCDEKGYVPESEPQRIYLNEKYKLFARITNADAVDIIKIMNPMGGQIYLPKFNRAMLISCFTKELFNYFECITFDNESTLIPSDVETYENRLMIQKNYASESKRLLSIDSNKLYETDQPFKKWVDNLKNRLTNIWCNGNKTEFETYFLNAVLIRDQFMNVCKRVFAFHKLYRSYPILPQMIRFESRDPVDLKYCNSSYQGKDGFSDDLPEDINEYKVVCTIMCGFKIGDYIVKCNVLWSKF